MKRQGRGRKRRDTGPGARFELRARALAAQRGSPSFPSLSLTPLRSLAFPCSPCLLNRASPSPARRLRPSRAQATRSRSPSACRPRTRFTRSRRQSSSCRPAGGVSTFPSSSTRSSTMVSRASPFLLPLRDSRFEAGQGSLPSSSMFVRAHPGHAVASSVTPHWHGPVAQSALARAWARAVTAQSRPPPALTEFDEGGLVALA